MRSEKIATRRAFLQRGLTLVGAAASVPAFLERSAWAVGPADGARTNSRPGVPDERILVVVQLAGGNDGLNTIIPVRNDIYYQSRPRIGIQSKDALKLNNECSLHPGLTGFKALYDDGLLGIVQGVGYPNPNRSHFKSSDIWETASPNGRLHTGWIGRYFDNTCKGEAKPRPESGIALTSSAPLSMLGKKFTPVAFQRPENLSWNGDRKNRDRKRNASMTASAFARLNQPDSPSVRAVTELDYLQRTALDAQMSAADIQKAAAGESTVSYPPSPFAQSLRTVARMIAANMPTKIYYVSQTGYDTHAAQPNRHQQLLTQLGGALKAFVDDLTASRQLDRVAIMTFSEFGRRVEENASGGTDHGAAAPMFVIGKQIKPGLHGKPASLEKLDNGDLAFTTDFRSVYAAMLKHWMGVDAGTILGQAFAPSPIFKNTNKGRPAL